MILTKSYQRIGQAYLGTSGGSLYVRIYAYYTEQDIANNRSYVRYQARAYYENGTYITDRQASGNVSGTSLPTISGSLSTIYTGETIIATTEGWIYHNNDGKKSINASANLSFPNWGWNATASGSADLPTIPRHANITAAPNFNDEENPTIYYSNPAGNAISSIQACISIEGLIDDIKYRDIPKTGSSYTFELTDEEREKLRNATLTSNTRKITFFVTSVIGGITHYSSLVKTLTIVNTMPEIVVSAKDVGAASKLLTGDETKIIKGFNYVLSSMSSTLKKGATIKSQTITNGSQSLIGEAGGVASMEGGFNNAENDTFIFGLTDSRGNTVNKYITLAMIDYVKLTCNLTVEKPTVDGNMNFSVSGNYFNDTFGAQYNYLALEYRLKKEGEDWNEWALITNEYTLQDNKYSVDVSITGLDYRKAYTIQVRAQDRINLIPPAEKTVKALPVYDWGKDDFQFNVDVLDKSGTKITNGLALYENDGIDPDTTLEHLILTHLNTPCNDFMYIKTEFYGSKTENSNRMQTAFPYYTNDPPYYRYYFNGAWTEWKTQNNYSTSEQIIGAWIDGKPVYRKVLETGALNGTNMKTIATPSGIDTLIKCEGLLYDGDGHGYPLNYNNVWNLQQDIGSFYYKDNGISIRCYSDFGIVKGHVIIEYTKTTD